MALCINKNALTGVSEYIKFPAKLQQTPAQEFAADNIGLLIKGEYQEFEDALGEYLDDNSGAWDEVHQALLEEAIDYNDTYTIDYIVKRMGEVKLLKFIDFEKDGKKAVPDSSSKFNSGWGGLSSPFVCNEPELVEHMMRGRYSDRMDYVMWTDGKKICMKACDLTEAALASGDEDMYDMLAGMDGVWGGLEDQDSVLLSDNLDIMKKLLRPEFDPDSEPLYWLEDETSNYAFQFISSVRLLDIRKILKAANSVFLRYYLAEFDDLDEEIVRSWRDELRRSYEIKVSVEIFRDLCESHRCYCMPYNMIWLEERKSACIRLLDEYLRGIRFYNPDPAEEEEMRSAWNGWDEYEDDNTYEKLPSEDYEE